MVKARGLWVEGVEGDMKVIYFIFVLHGGHTRLIDSQANDKYRPTLKAIFHSYLGLNCYPIAIKNNNFTSMVEMYEAQSHKYL